MEKRSCYNCPALGGKIHSPQCWLQFTVFAEKGKYYSNNCQGRPKSRKELYKIQSNQGLTTPIVGEEME